MLQLQVMAQCRPGVQQGKGKEGDRDTWWADCRLTGGREEGEETNDDDDDGQDKSDSERLHVGC